MIVVYNFFIFSRLFEMNSENDLLESHMNIKAEPIDTDFIKKEKDECFAVAGIVNSNNDAGKSIKTELYSDEEDNVSSLSHVRMLIISFP